MFNSRYLSLKLVLFFAWVAILSSCIKNDNYVEGDSKIKFYNNVLGSKSQVFYIDGNLGTDNGMTLGNRIELGYGNNSPYVIAQGNKSFKIFVKNADALDPHTSGDISLGIGDNYAVFYTKNKSNDSTLYIIKEDLSPDTSSSKVLFVNLGYTLKSKVVVRDSLNTFNKVLGYGEKTDYLFLKFAGKNKLYFNLVDSTGVVDTIKAFSFNKGKIYTILLDGLKNGKLKQRLISNN